MIEDRYLSIKKTSAYINILSFHSNDYWGDGFRALNCNKIRCNFIVSSLNGLCISMDQMQDGLMRLSGTMPLHSEDSINEKCRTILS